MTPCFPNTWDSETDVVVIGYGGAGAVTAITAFNAGTEVLDPDGKPVLRLFSSGNCGSIYRRTSSVGGGNLAEACAFGCIAGRNAAGLRSWKWKLTKSIIRGKNAP